MLRIELEADAFGAGGMVRLGCIPGVVATANDADNRLDFERKFWPRINAAIASGALIPVDSDTLTPLRSEDAGNGLVPVHQLVEWGKAIGILEFVVVPPVRELEAALSSLPGPERKRWDTAVRSDSTHRRMVVWNLAGSESSSWQSLNGFLGEVHDRLARWKGGNYWVHEAAQVLADATPELDAGELCRQMEAAIHDGGLAVRKNGIKLKISEIPPGIWSDYVRADDVNAWLAQERATYTLHYPYEEPTSAGAAAAALESPPVQRLRAQEVAVLNAIRSLDHDPKHLPPFIPGRRWVKADVRDRLADSPLFVGGTILDAAWERLRGNGEIAEGGVPQNRG